MTLDFSSSFTKYLGIALTVVLGFLLLPVILNLMGSNISPLISAVVAFGGNLSGAGFTSLASLFTANGLLNTIIVFSILGVVIYLVYKMIAVPKK
jgi:large-conductance mechanosensitive channel